MKMSMFKKSMGVGVLLLSVQAALAVVPVDLRCEHLREPMGLDVATPRLSWKLVDDAAERGQLQTAWHIRAASTPEQLAEGMSDLWDSGVVRSSQSVLVPYGGPAPTSNQSIYWQVRVHDKDGEPSPWSDPARFTMGLLDADDWQGPWIHHPDAPVTKHIWFRRNLTLDQSVESALIHIAALGYHELFVNGKKVADHHLAPAASRLDQRVLYLTYDLSGLLKPGENAIAIWHGPGWARYSFFRTRPALRVQMNATLGDGSSLALASDASWRCAISSSENIGEWHYGNNGGERIDARLHHDDWHQPGFDDSGWSKPAEAAMAVALSPQMMAPTRVIETIPAKSIADRGGAYRVDMGRNFTGFLHVRMRGLSEGDEVLIQVANRDGHVEDFHQRAVFVSAGGDEEVFQHRFNYMAGRYVTISGLKSEPRLEEVTGLALSTDLRRTGAFTSSNELLNEIYETDLWTWRANLTEGFTADCPHRERLGYGEVAFACAWGIAFPGYDAAAMYIKHVRDWSDVQRPDGSIHHTAPQINEHYGGPMWSSAGLNIAWAHYQHFGDRRVLELTYPASRRWLEFLHARTRDGLLARYDGHWGRFLGEWAAPDHVRAEGDPEIPRYFNNCVYAMNLASFVAIAAILGNDEDAQFYEERLTALRQRMHEVYYRPDLQIYSTGRQVELAFALLAGLPSASLRPAIEQRFLEALHARPYLQMGSSGLPVLMKYLVEEAEGAQVVFEHLNRTEQPSYGHFLKRGETTWPEYWSVDVPSRIHTCYTGVSSWMTMGVAGIRPDPAHPGYQSFLIQPVVGGDLTFAEGHAESMYGRISSRWELSDAGLEIAVTIPPNSRATVSLPTLGTPDGLLVIREGDRVIWDHDRVASTLPGGIAFAHRHGAPGPNRRIAWTVGAGSYRFFVKLLGTPARLDADGSGEEVELQWSAAIGAAAYSVGRATLSGGPYEIIATGLADTTYTDAAVARNQEYFYVVVPESSSGTKGAPGPEASARTGLQPLRNAGFEEPATSAFVYAPSGAGWLFTPLSERSGSGVTANNSPFTEGNPPATEGTQAAFLQGTASITQTLRGLKPGAVYRITFYAAPRANRTNGGQTWDVRIDDETIGSFAPPAENIEYAFHAARFTASEPQHTLSFVGTNQHGGDNTVFIDEVQLVPDSE